jgi:hypothetical protein
VDNSFHLASIIMSFLLLYQEEAFGLMKVFPGMNVQTGMTVGRQFLEELT